MNPNIAKLVGLETQPEPLMAFAQRLKDLVKMSRDEMAKSYDMWDRNDMVYRGERVPDEKDLKARKRGEPEKMILPLTFGQVQTFTAFGYSLFNQRDYFFEMIASGQEDEAPAKIATALLEQNLTYNKFRETRLVQFLTDIARFGIGVTKETWVHEQCPIVQEVPAAPSGEVRADLAAPVQTPMVKQMTYQTKYLGNKIVNVSPYRWFPDVRLPLSRWTEGEFCADEIEESVRKLKTLEREGTIAGLQHVSALPNEAFDSRRLQFLKKEQADPVGLTQVNSKEYYLLTEVQVRLNPAQTEIAEGVMLDPDTDYDCVYIVWLLNEDRIVRISPANYDHEEFGYNCSQLFDDQNRFINFSLCEILAAVQDTATWFLNSHITSVRKTMFNQLVVDPSGIEIDDIIKRSPVIRTKAGRGPAGMDSWIKQLTVQDVTGQHVTDIAALSGYAKEATGINETLLGQFSSGRRSAREASNVASYASSRLTMLFASIWTSGIATLGRKMLSNLRQGLDVPTLVRMYGEINTMNEQQAAVQLIPGLVQPQPMYRLNSVTKANLIGNYDFAVFNGTLPTQRQQTAATLQELLGILLKDPRMVLALGLDPQLIAFEVLELLNVRNVKRFQLTPERLQQLIGMAQVAGNAGSAGPSQGSGGGPNGGRPAPSAKRN